MSEKNFYLYIPYEYLQAFCRLAEESAECNYSSEAAIMLEGKFQNSLRNLKCDQSYKKHGRTPAMIIDNIQKIKGVGMSVYLEDKITPNTIGNIHSHFLYHNTDFQGMCPSHPDIQSIIRTKEEVMGIGLYDNKFKDKFIIHFWSPDKPTPIPTYILNIKEELGRIIPVYSIFFKKHKDEWIYVEEPNLRILI